MCLTVWNLETASYPVTTFAMIHMFNHMFNVKFLIVVL